MTQTIYPDLLTPGYLASYGTQQTPTPGNPNTQPLVLIAHWEADAAGTVTLDNTLGVPVVTEWRDKLYGRKLTAPTLTQSPAWLPTTSMPSNRPGIGFDGIDDWLDGEQALKDLMANTTGLSASITMAAALPATGAFNRVLTISHGASVDGLRLGYSLSGLNPSGQFYIDGNSLDTDPYVYVGQGTIPYEGWAVHTVIRDFVGQTANATFNDELKATASSIGSIGPTSNTSSQVVRVGAGGQGGQGFVGHIYSIKLYTKALNGTEVSADNAEGNGKVNA
jgi:Concanavalin A-like lectin/glucanases superfamily